MFDTTIFQKQSMGFLRKEYLDKIKESFEIKWLVKVLLWQRRSWKSVIMKQLISYLMEEKKIPINNILYLDFEQYEIQKEISTVDDLHELIHTYRKNNYEKCYLFIDEIQFIPNWELYINSLRSGNQNIEIIISWSNSKLLSWELATHLAGRYLSFFIQPFSYEEYLWIVWEKKGIESLTTYLNLWWMPELFNLQTKQLRTNYIHQLNDTIIFKDICSRYWVKDYGILSMLYFFLLGNIGNTFSFNALKHKLDDENISLSVPTLSNYIRYFKDTFIFHEVDRYDLIGKKVLEWEKKYYLNDLAFLNFSLSNYIDYNGRKLENYVYNYLIRQGYQVYIGKLKNKEIDFIAEKQGEKIYLQVAYSLADPQVFAREFGNLREIKDSFPKYVISMDPIQMGTDEFGIVHQLAWDLDL